MKFCFVNHAVRQISSCKRVKVLKPCLNTLYPKYTFYHLFLPNTMKLITETHADHIQGVLSCYDRIILQGTLPPFCYADGMTSYLYQKNIRIFDYKEQFAQPLRNEIIRNAE